MKVERSILAGTKSPLMQYAMQFSTVPLKQISMHDPPKNPPDLGTRRPSILAMHELRSSVACESVLPSFRLQTAVNVVPLRQISRHVA
ncbi:unnamed protein product [Rotaria sp. Silwood2]|nr:unnamed protein product [Rotaria sp. Silwood2]CAF3225431.1 unnamed protein product [Rotaria sp. Silwood2]CAF3608502.1 unnamed protein product [Rotaria sp. Silwood2]CAF4586733.1 unnamed protein product [Rotaria sp. Silwood2]CAF4880360.1 unnamed protein product [Rotaria sp. Silwood2]